MEEGEIGKSEGIVVMYIKLKRKKEVKPGKSKTERKIKQRSKTTEVNDGNE